MLWSRHSTIAPPNFTWQPSIIRICSENKQTCIWPYHWLSNDLVSNILYIVNKNKHTCLWPYQLLSNDIGSNTLYIINKNKQTGLWPYHWLSNDLVSNILYIATKNKQACLWPYHLFIGQYPNYHFCRKWYYQNTIYFADSRIN